MARAKKEVESAQVEKSEENKAKDKGYIVAAGVVLVTLGGVKCEGEKIKMTDLNFDFAKATKKADYLVSVKKLVKA